MIGTDVLGPGLGPGVGQAVTGEAERHAEPAVFVLEVLVGGALVLRPLPAGLAPPHQLVGSEDQVDLGLDTPVPQGDLRSGRLRVISNQPNN